MSKRKRKPEQKGRFFTFLIYPDSAPEGWVEELEDIGLPIAISPIHDKDEADQKHVEMIISDNRAVWSKEQQDEYRRSHKYKKEHYHLIYVAKNSVTPSAVRKRIQRTLGDNVLAMVQRVDNIMGMYDYLSHTSTSAKDAGKHEYDPEDIIHLNGFDIQKYEKLSTEEVDDMLIDILGIIKREKLMNIVQLDDFIDKHGEEYGIDNFRTYMITVRRHIYYVSKYFDAVYQNNKREEYIRESIE